MNTLLINSHDVHDGIIVETKTDSVIKMGTQERKKIKVCSLEMTSIDYNDSSVI